jgi:hypothetical protein
MVVSYDTQINALEIADDMLVPSYLRYYTLPISRPFLRP